MTRLCHRKNAASAKVSDDRPTHLDLFSGIGGFALAAQWAGFRTIGFCEIDKFCRKVIAKNFLADTCGVNGWKGRTFDRINDEWRNSDDVGSGGAYRPLLFGNVFDFDGIQFAGVSLITGGFPCQPFSVAGKRRGAADDRAIWPQMLRVIGEARSAFVLGENVPGIVTMELDNVLSDLEGIGYATRAFVIPACAVGTFHRRDRVWIIGRNVSYPKRHGLSRSPQRGSPATAEGEQSSGAHHSFDTARTDSISAAERNVSDPLSQRRCSRNAKRQNAGDVGELRGGSWHEQGAVAIWEPEPNVGRMAHGVPNRVDRLKGLGNAIVPQVAYEILRGIYDEIKRSCTAAYQKSS